MGIIEIKDLTFYYPETNIPAVDDLSLTVNSGDFFVLLGSSGCGKSTLLRQLKPQLAPHGVKKGMVLFDNTDIYDMDERESTSKIGFVVQSPDNQIVTDKVWHELAFGLESLGLDNSAIRRRVAEMASFFGIQNWFYKNVSELSGGQKQLLNLASVMVMQPSVLILDEPTSQLDPIAASDFLSVLKKINQELATTIIITEHRLEEVLPLANRSAVMENGKLLFCGDVADTAKYLKQNNHSMFASMPCASKIWSSVESDSDCPVSVNEGRNFIKKYCENNSPKPVEMKVSLSFSKKMICADDVWFRYEKDLPDVVKGVSLSAYSGELLCLLGGNATGKTTLLKLLSGCYKPYSGEIKTNAVVCLLPQNPQTLFVKKTVSEDLCEILKNKKTSKQKQTEKIKNVLSLCRLEGLENRHPFDLSGGEQQRLALAKILLLNPDVLLLDEPTKGFDAQFKIEFANILKDLRSNGVCIIMVSHDIEFCAEYADRCALFFDGNIAAQGTPQEFFCKNNFYTTSANRIAGNIIPNAVTTDDVIKSIGGKVIQQSETPAIKSDIKTENNDFLNNKTGKLPLWRKICACVSAVFALAVYFYAAKNESLTEMVDLNGITQLGIKQIVIYGLFLLFLILTAVFIGKRSKPSISVKPPAEKRKLSKRTILSVVLVLMLVPLTLFIGFVYVDAKQYYITALAILIECMLPFFMVFEGRKPKARELVVIAVLCALNIAGRSSLFMLPQFKPVIALTIISGVALGGETGFLVGAVTMLVSNMLFSQGPWTPWQMFALGIIGFFAGVLFQKGWLKRSKMSLSIFGAVSAIVIYGGIMNPASALLWGGDALNWNIILSYYVTGFPLDCVQALGTAVFLWLIADPMLEKLDRIKVKYGLVE